jgi:hypothetical protein
MTAKEMFEKLGFSKTIFPNGTIQYEKVKKDKMSRVRFYLEDKVYSTYYTELSENGVEIRQMTRLINTKTHKAINKQIEELGWNK